MTSFTAQIENWTRKAERNAEKVIASAAQDVFADMSERQPSISETGTFEIGKVPVDTGFLINSLFASLNGFPAGQGQTAYVAAVAGFELGDTITFAFTAEYAPAIEYGTVNMPGRFMVREALNGGGGWQARVNKAAARFVD